jgi:hypothetical protein
MMIDPLTDHAQPAQDLAAAELQQWAVLSHRYQTHIRRVLTDVLQIWYPGCRLTHYNFDTGCANKIVAHGEYWWSTGDVSSDQVDVPLEYLWNVDYYALELARKDSLARESASVPAPGWEPSPEQESEESK